MRKFPYHFNKSEHKEYEALVRQLAYEENYFLADACSKARATIEGKILTRELNNKEGEI